MTSTEGLTATCAAALGLPNPLNYTTFIVTATEVKSACAITRASFDFLQVHTKIWNFQLE